MLMGLTPGWYEVTPLASRGRRQAREEGARVLYSRGGHLLYDGDFQRTAGLLQLQFQLFAHGRSDGVGIGLTALLLGLGQLSPQNGSPPNGREPGQNPRAAFAMATPRADGYPRFVWI
jgi:hypothetical protein